MRFLITTLAEYQSRFWLAVGVELKRLGHEPAFISFDDRSTEMLRNAQLPVFSATEGREALDVSDAALAAALEQHDISDLNFWFGHERYAFGLRDSADLRRKLLGALAAAGEACRTWSADGPVTMIQELGGFLSVVGSFFAARRHGIDNWFLEPSFYRGRLFFLRNSFAALPVTDLAEGPPDPEVARYLADTISKGSIVVPMKDRHQYTTAWKKVVNRRNARRLVEKLFDKHVRGKRQEFGYIGTHVKVHARMLLSSLRLRSHYTPLADCGRFVYYPLHVPGDMALTLRSPHLLDQLALIDYICRCVPHTHRVAIKEHPAMIGAVDALRVRQLLERHDNLVLLPPSTNNYEVLRRSAAVISVNSKSGAEAALIGKPVVVLGDAFYRHSPLVSSVENVRDLPAALRAALADAPRHADDTVARYFAAVWARSLPGELYVVDETNVRTFTQSLITATRPLEP